MTMASFVCLKHKCMKKVLISTIFIVLSCLCANISGAVSAFHKLSDSSFYGKKWYVKTIHLPIGNDLPSFKTDTIIGKTTFIVFNNQKKSASGNGGCNSFGGTVSVQDNHITISQLISTQMYCEGIQQTEDDFFKALLKVNRLEIKNKNLLLYQDKLLLLELESE